MVKQGCRFMITKFYIYVTVSTMAAVCLSIVLTAVWISSIDAAIIKKGHKMAPFQDLHKIDEHHELRVVGNEQKSEELLEELMREIFEIAVEDDLFDRMPEDDNDRMPEDDNDRMPEDDNDRMPDDDNDRMPEDDNDRMPDDDRMPGDDNDRMPDDDDENSKDEEGQKRMVVLRGNERKAIPFWNKTKLCNYHECFSQLKTWPDVPYYLLKDGNFLIDWPTKYIRIFLIYNKNAVSINTIY
ncbi:protein bfr2-like [Branchiostoma floridae]|uniref:Protein bfr2-like n=1 Tax=Branchiostoma floridae TaxID=7739 RepID=A0A9J7M206_BRAFL|nr:protein bfr2-like [Branchiostoma floridae]